MTLQTLPPAGVTSIEAAAVAGGFSLHAGVATRTGERRKLERLCRYINRLAVSEQRMSLTPDGRIGYELKTPSATVQRRSSSSRWTPNEWPGVRSMTQSASPCPSCGGSGGLTASHVRSCMTCRGTGYVFQQNYGDVSAPAQFATRSTHDQYGVPITNPGTAPMSVFKSIGTGSGNPTGNPLLLFVLLGQLLYRLVGSPSVREVFFIGLCGISLFSVSQYDEFLRLALGDNILAPLEVTRSLVVGHSEPLLPYVYWVWGPWLFSGLGMVFVAVRALQSGRLDGFYRKMMRVPYALLGIVCVLCAIVPVAVDATAAISRGVPVAGGKLPNFANAASGVISFGATKADGEPVISSRVVGNWKGFVVVNDAPLFLVPTASNMGTKGDACHFGFGTRVGGRLYVPFVGTYSAKAGPEAGGCSIYFRVWSPLSQRGSYEPAVANLSYAAGLP